MPTVPPNVQTRDLSSWAGRISAAWDALNGRPFGPGVPLQPTPPPTPEQAITTPRQYQYPMAVNSVISTPRRDQPGLTPFDQLRNLAAVYDVAAICIGSLIEEFQRKKWAIVAKDKHQQRELQPRCDMVTAFWSKPDQLNDYVSWLTMALYEILTIDALTLYKRPNKGGGLYALDLVDGSTIKPLIDDRGRVVAYQQIVYGRPESQYKRPSADTPDEQLPIYAPTELMYKPRWARSWTPYGFPPTEWIIVRINQALRKQTFDLSYFTDGNIPDMLATAPEGLMTPEQIQQFEEYFNAILEGNDAARRKMRFMPWKAEVKELRPFSYETALDYFMMQITCAAYGRMPQALGFVESVNRSQGVVQNDITELREESLAVFLKTAVFDPVTQGDLGEPDLEWQWVNDRIIEDELTEAQIHQADITSGVISADESRTLRYASRLDGPAPKGALNGETIAPPPAVAATTDLTQNLAVGVSKPQGINQAGANSVSHKVDLVDDKVVAKRGEADRDEWEREANKLMRQIYAAQLDRLTDTLDKMPERELAGLQAELAQMWQTEPTLVKKAVLPFFDELARYAAYSAVEDLAWGANWEGINTAVLRLAQERALAFARQLSEASEIQTAEIVADWISTGGTMPELIERISQVWQGRRPDVAAVDAVTDLFAQGQRTAWKASGVVKGYTISTAKDDVVCPICRPKQGEYHDIDDIDGLPGFHNYCRCDIRPVVMEPGEIR